MADKATQVARPVTTVSDVLPGPVRDRGVRNQEFGRLLCGWYSGARLSKEQTLAKAEAWVRRDDHAGSLSIDNPRREQLISAMLRDAAKDIDRQARKLAEGRLKPGALRQRARAPNTVPCLSLSQVIVPLVAQTENWRETARDCLTADDQARIAAVADRWVAPRLTVFVGLIRYLERKHGLFDKLALDTRALERIAGKRPRDDAAAYKMMLERARAAGILGPMVKKGRAGITASIYEVPREARHQPLPFSQRD